MRKIQDIYRRICKGVPAQPSFAPSGFPPFRWRYSLRTPSLSTFARSLAVAAFGVATIPHAVVNFPTKRVSFRFLLEKSRVLDTPCSQNSDKTHEIAIFVGISWTISNIFSIKKLKIHIFFPTKTSKSPFLMEKSQNNRNLCSKNSHKNEEINSFVGKSSWEWFNYHFVLGIDFRLILL